MAFIIDIRHGNLDVQLLYKALFELSKDRAEFVSRLFSRRRPDGLTAQSSVADIFTAVQAAETSEAIYNDNLQAVEGYPDGHAPLPALFWRPGRHRVGAWQLLSIRTIDQLQLEPVSKRAATDRGCVDHRPPRRQRVYDLHESHAVG